VVRVTVAAGGCSARRPAAVLATWRPCRAPWRPMARRPPLWKETLMTDTSTTPAPQAGQPPAPPLPEPTPSDDVLEMEPTIEGEDFSRVAFTAAAVTQIQRLIDRNGPLMFHQSGGCCDGSSPMCYPEG